MTPTELEGYLALLPARQTYERLFRQWGYSYRWLITITVMVGNVATMLSGTIINVAIPNIMGAFGIGQDHAQWLATANLAAATVTMLAGAWVQRTFGLRRTMSLTMLLFLVGCLCGGAANSLDMLIVSRVLQGIAAGITTPLALTVIFEVFPAGRQGVALGISSMGMIVAPAIGPAVGGVLVDAFNWRYVFYLGVPFALVSLAGSLLFMPARQPLPRTRLDVIGMVLLAVTITSMLTGLSNGEREGWDSDYVLGCFGAMTAAGATFLWWELRHPHPLLNVALFSHRNFMIMALNVFIFNGGMYAASYLMPLFLQLVQKLTPTVSGAMMMPGGLTLILLLPISGRLADRVQHRLLIGIGICFSFVSFGLMGTGDANTALVWIALWLMLSRIGIGLVMPALRMGAIKSVAHVLVPQASGAFNFFGQLGGAIGVNLMSMTLERRTAQHLDLMNATQTWANTTTVETLHRLTALSHRIGYRGFEEWDVARSLLQKMVQQEALIAGFHDCFSALAVAFLLTALPSLWLRDSHSPHKTSRIVEAEAVEDGAALAG